MQHLQFLRLTRSDLALISSGSATPQYGSLDYVNQPPMGSDIYAYWARDRISPNLPSLIVVPEGKKEEFFAWSLSFIQNLTPITSFIWVLDWSEYIEVISLKSRNLSAIGASMAAAITGEVLTNTSFYDRNIDSIPLCEGTCGAAIAQALKIGYSPTSLKNLVGRWQYLVEASGRSQKVSAMEILRIWNILLSLARNAGPSKLRDEDLVCFDICRSIQHEGNIYSEQWNNLVRSEVGDLRGEFIFDLRAPKEKRIARFVELVSGVMATSNPRIGGLAIGLAASLISPGETVHWELVQRYATMFPLAPLWYQVCASLYPESCVLVERNHFRTRLIESLLDSRELFSAPWWDVSLDEFEVMLRDQGELFHFRQLSPIFKVGLFPGVSVAAASPNSEREAQLDFFDSSRPTDVNFPVEELRKLLSSIRVGVELAEGLVKSKPPSKSSKKKL